MNLLLLESQWLVSEHPCSVLVGKVRELQDRLRDCDCGFNQEGLSLWEIGSELSHPGKLQTGRRKAGDRVGEKDVHGIWNHGEGDGTPLQYSCLENPMDGGAWWAAVHGVVKSQTWLSDFTFTFHFHALEKECSGEPHSSVLAWRIPGNGEPGGLLSMGSHRVGHDWSDLAAAAADWNWDAWTKHHLLVLWP